MIASTQTVAVLLKHVVNSGYQLVLTVERRCVWNRLLKVEGVLALNLDVGPHHDLDLRRVQAPGVVARDPQLLICRRVDAVVTHDPDQPWIDPILRLEKSSRECHRRGGHKRRAVPIQHVVPIVAIFPKAPELEAVAELIVESATRAIEGLVECGQTRKELPVLVEFVPPVVTKGVES